MGDFSFDLLSYETNTGTAGFLNSIVQFGFLPHPSANQDH